MSDIRVECVQTGQHRTFQTSSIADARGPYSLESSFPIPPRSKMRDQNLAPIARRPQPALHLLAQAFLEQRRQRRLLKVRPSRVRTHPPTRRRQLQPSTSDVSATSSGGTAHLSAVRLGPRDGYDRLVLDFTGSGAWLPDRVSAAANAGGSVGRGHSATGGERRVQTALTSATGSGLGPGERTYSGPSTVTADTAVVTEAKAAGDFEGVLSWVVGVRSEVPFRVSRPRRATPPRHRLPALSLADPS